MKRLYSRFVLWLIRPALELKVQLEKEHWETVGRSQWQAGRRARWEYMNEHIRQRREERERVSDREAAD
ncbi:hypothetical protein [Burkholderia cepacia]|uniref:hypothetical protein n=1 Tax=Burkholderia cepacia TaxID=292 RepID=UPI000A82AC1B|nr:hypothetical protein [Burkholderia cepacia]